MTIIFFYRISDGEIVANFQRPLMPNAGISVMQIGKPARCFIDEEFALNFLRKKYPGNDYAVKEVAVQPGPQSPIVQAATGILRH